VALALSQRSQATFSEHGCLNEFFSVAARF
jgi:hypothetical protein